MEEKYIELDNGLKFLVLSKHTVDDNDYLFLVSVTKKPTYVFTKVIDEDTLEPVEDPVVLTKLTQLLSESLQKEFSNINEESKKEG